MVKSVMKFLEDECGATAVEYAMIVALVSVGVVGGIDMMGQGADAAMASAGQETVAQP